MGAGDVTALGGAMSRKKLHGVSHAELDLLEFCGVDMELLPASIKEAITARKHDNGVEKSPEPYTTGDFFVSGRPLR